MNKYLTFFASLVIVLCSPMFLWHGVTAQETSTTATIDFFWGEGCPHCAKEKIFLADLEQEYHGKVQIHSYEVYSSEANQRLLIQYADARDMEVTGVPATFIGDEMITGFESAETTGAEIRSLIAREIQKSIIPESAVPATNSAIVDEQAESEVDDQSVRVPLLGTIDALDVSLPFLTIILGAVDGFNPCAMWVLIMLIGMLIGMQDRKRMLLLGSIFIVTSALMYFVFLAAWFNLFRFVGLVRWVQIVVGIVASGIGIFYIRRFMKTRPGQCEVVNVTQRKKISERMREVIQKRSLLFAIAGIIGLALVVNLIELACSAGLPAIFTQVLALHDVPIWRFYALLFLYVFVFMLDDLVVFMIAVLTFKIASGKGTYSRFAMLLGGIIIILIGLALILKPAWLTLQ